MRYVEPSTRPDAWPYEDFVVGEVLTFGRWAVTAEDITEYGRTFDPQPFHISEETAKDTNIGRLIASGYHTCSILMRMSADAMLGGEMGSGSPGVDDVRFLKPVEPGDVLTGRFECLSKRPLKSRPGIGLMKCALALVNDRGEDVITWQTNVFRRMRNASTTGEVD